MSEMLSYDELIRKIADLESRNDELERFAKSFETVTDAFAFTDLEGRFINVNTVFCELLGYSREELLLLRSVDLRPEYLHEQCKKHFELLKKKGNLTLETVYQHKDTTFIPVELSSTVIQHRKDLFVYIVVRDITQRKQREDVLHCLEKIIKLGHDLIAYVDSDYIYRVVNEQFSKDNNMRPEQMIGRSIAEVLGEEVFVRSIKPRIDRCFAGEIVRYQAWFKHKSRGRCFRDVSYYPNQIDDGSINGVFAVIRDLTDYKLIQEEKEIEHILFSTVLDRIGGGVYLISKSHELIYVNSHLLKTFGPIDGRRCYEYIAHRETPCPWCKSDTVFSCDHPVDWTYKSTSDNRLYAVFETMVKNTSFKSVKMCFFQDITISKNREQELIGRTRLLEEIVNISSTIIYVKDKDGKYLYGNRQFENLFIRHLDTFYGKTDLDIFPEQYARQFQEHDKVVLTSGKVNIFEENISYDDSEHFYISTKFPLIDEQGILYAVGGITTDITERKQMEQELMDQNEKMLILINTSPDAICFKDGEGRWLLANEAVLKLFRLEKVDYVGKTDVELAEHSTFYKEALLTCRDTDELVWQSKKLSRNTEFLPQPDGNMKIYDTLKVPIFGQDGRRKGLVIIGRDVTDCVNNLEKLERKNDEILHTNIALQVLIDQQGDKCRAQEQQIMTTLRRLIFPYLENLAQVDMEENGQRYVQMIASHLHSLTNSFCRKLDDPVIGLSPKEFLVADLVRQGRSSSDIARLLGLTSRTVEVYRTSVRKKLKINGKKINLKLYLTEKFSQ